MYFLKFRAKPDESSPEYGDFQDGIAHIWVKAASPDKAEFLSLSYMRKHHLVPTTLELCIDSLDVPLQQLGTSESALYRRSEQYGIALDYIAAPFDESTGLAGFRPLKS